MNKSITQQFICNNTINEFKVGIFARGILINFDPSNIYDITIEYNYTSTSIVGILRMKDVGRTLYLLGQSIVALPLIIEGIDCFNIKQTSVFMVTYFNRTSTDTGEELVTIEFIDEWTYIMNNTFISKGFNNTNSAEVLGNITKEFRDNKKFLEKKALYVDKDLEKIENLIVPGNLSLLQWCNFREHIEGFELLNSRNSITFIKAIDIWKKAKSIKATLRKSLFEVSPFTFINMTFNLNNIHTNSIPATNFIKFKDEDIKNPEEIKISSKDIFDKLGLNTTFVGIGDTLMYGDKYYGRYTNSSNLEKLYINKILSTNFVEVKLSVGSYIYGLGQKINLESPKVVGGTDSKKAPDIDGEYLIAGIIDIYKGANFYQTLHLMRAGVE